MLDTLKICQHNTARGQEILQSFFEVALKEESDLLFVQEPYTFYHNSTHTYIPTNHSAFNLIPPLPTTNLRPRVLTYVKKSSNLQVSPRYDLVSDPDFQILEVEIPTESFYVIHIYNEKTTSHYSIKLTVERFLDLHLILDKPFLFLGDFNLHHSHWNPMVQNNIPLANKFVKYLDEINAQLLNRPSIIEQFGGTFHRANSRGTSIIDLTFAVGFQVLRWGDWKYGQSTGSDHEVITIQTDLPTASGGTHHHNYSNNNSLPMKFNLKRADWSLFKDQLLLMQSHLQNQIPGAWILEEARAARNKYFQQI